MGNLLSCNAIILDEPQKMGGNVTQKVLKNFNPLFSLTYSATHAKQHNLVYVLDAPDAFNKRLVKKIGVKGFEVRNFRGTDEYLYPEQIALSSNKPPMARIELEIGYNKSINRETRVHGAGDNLFYISQEMDQYKGFTVSEIAYSHCTIIYENCDHEIAAPLQLSLKGNNYLFSDKRRNPTDAPSVLTEQVQAVYPCKSTAFHTAIHPFRFRFDDNSLLLSSKECPSTFEILGLCEGAVNLSGYAEMHTYFAFGI